MLYEKRGQGHYLKIIPRRFSYCLSTKMFKSSGCYLTQCIITWKQSNQNSVLKGILAHSKTELKKTSSSRPKTSIIHRPINERFRSVSYLNLNSDPPLCNKRGNHSNELLLGAHCRMISTLYSIDVISLFISYLSFYMHCCTLPDKRCLSHGLCLYQVIMTLYFLNDVANDAESTQKSKITS